jgi:hypothetical protein
MRRDVIHIRGHLNNAQLIAVLADRMLAKMNQPRRLPFGIRVQPPRGDRGRRSLRLFAPCFQLGLAPRLMLFAMRQPRQSDIIATCRHADLRSRHRISPKLFESPQRKNARRFPVGAFVDDALFMLCRWVKCQHHFSWKPNQTLAFDPEQRRETTAKPLTHHHLLTNHGPEEPEGSTCHRGKSCQPICAHRLPCALPHHSLMA